MSVGKGALKPPPQREGGVAGPGLGPAPAAAQDGQLVEDTLYFVAQKGWTESRQGYIDALVRFLGERVGCDYALVSELLPGGARARVVGAYSLGSIAPLPPYDLAGTPCEHVFAGRLCCYASRVQALFPEDRSLADLGVESYVGIPLWGLGGEAIGLIAVMGRRPLDGADQQRIESALQIVALRCAHAIESGQREARLLEYRRLLHEAADGFWLVDASGRLADVNEAYCHMSGYSRGELLEMSISAVEAVESPAEVAAHVRRVFERGSDRFETVHRRKDGSLLDVEVFAPHWSTGGQIAVLLTDVTKRKQHVAALEAADRRKDEFLALLSHELRNPLTPVRNGLYVLGRAPPGSEQAHRALAVVDRQVGHLTRLVDELLDVTRIARGKTELNRETLDLTDLLPRVIEDHRSVFEARGVTLETELPSPGVQVSADRLRLAQAIGNLLQNAAKFTARGGLVAAWLRVDDARREAVLGVRDDGAGIAPEMMPRLFEPFAQADRTLARSAGGLGLGLAVVKGLVEMHGGLVRAESAGLGRGAEFTIRLPLEGSPAPALAAAPRTPADAPPRRVLVIEDGEDAAESLRQVLELHGHAVEVARDGLAGLERARARRPDLVLCDLGLPLLDGYEVARALRADPELRCVALVALTGYARHEDVARALEAGYDAHIAKPPTAEALDAALALAEPRRR